MPINAQYSWVDKRDSLKVIIPLKGVSASKTDIFVSGSTLKVNFNPYLLDLVLFKNIDPVRHKASVKDGVLTVTLFKKDPEPWEALVAEGEDHQLLEKKKQALAEQASLDAELDSQRSDRRIAEEKHALRKQMKLEEMERNRVENLKQEEKEQAEKEVYDTFAKMNHQQMQQQNGRTVSAQQKTVSKQKKSVHFSDVPETEEESIDNLLAADDIEDEQEGVHPSNEVDEDKIDEENDHEGDEHEVEGDDDYYFVSSPTADEQEIRYVPPPRVVNLADASAGDKSSNKLGINFTPRVFPTPMRESKAAEEEDWIAKNRKHLKKHGVLGKSLTKGNGVDVSEEDPVWLKAKGDDFLRSGDVRSALNAYSAALDADDKIVACYANRSICYLKLHMYADCKSDCSRGIELISEEMETCASNKSSDSAAVQSVGKLGAMLVKLYLRRGAAICQLGQYTEALSDYLQASTRFQQLHSSQLSALSAVDITLESITADSQRLKLLNEVDRMKKNADLTFADKNIEEAKRMYTSALQILPVHVGCLSNRAACYMALGDIQNCIDDCSTAIALLIQSSDSSQKQTNMLQYILPPVGSEKRKAWTIKTLLRRGVALSQQQRFNEAVLDYARAAALDPENESIQADYKRMLELRDQATHSGASSLEVQ